MQLSFITKQYFIISRYWYQVFLMLSFITFYILLYQDIGMSYNLSSYALIVTSRYQYKMFLS